jgi:hypothetical protein
MITRVLLVSLFVVASARVASADELDPGAGGVPTTTPIAVPPGLYLVTDVYAGSVVSTYGATTVYSTMTVRASPGTYARVLDVVGTGVASAFDGRSFNGRGRLGDGRQVAGAYYETFVRTASGFTPVNIVFFQDDSETRALVAPTPSSTVPTARPVLPSAAPIATPQPPTLPAPTMPPIPVVAAAIALASDGPALSAIDVLRGRVVHLWPRIFIDGRSAPVGSWRLVSGRVDQLSRSTGSGAQPADVAWLDPATDLALAFTVTDAVYGRTAIATLRVSVRSPALVQ